MGSQRRHRFTPMASSGFTLTLSNRLAAERGVREPDNPRPIDTIGAGKYRYRREEEREESSALN